MDETGRSAPASARTLGLTMFAVALLLLLWLKTLPINVVLPLALMAILLDDAITVAKHYHQLSWIDIACQAVFLTVLFSVMLGGYFELYSRRTFEEFGVFFFFGLVIYKPQHLAHGNRFAALVLNLLIALSVLPITLGLVIDHGSIAFFTLVFVVLVLCLWVFNSRILPWFFE